MAYSKSKASNSNRPLTGTFELSTPVNEIDEISSASLVIRAASMFCSKTHSLTDPISSAVVASSTEWIV